MVKFYVSCLGVIVPVFLASGLKIRTTVKPEIDTCIRAFCCQSTMRILTTVLLHVQKLIRLALTNRRGTINWRPPPGLPCPIKNRQLRPYLRTSQAGIHLRTQCYKHPGIYHSQSLGILAYSSRCIPRPSSCRDIPLVGRSKPWLNAVATQPFQQLLVRLWIWLADSEQIAGYQILRRHLDTGSLEVATNCGRVTHCQTPNSEPCVSKLYEMYHWILFRLMI